MEKSEEFLVGLLSDVQTGSFDYKWPNQAVRYIERKYELCVICTHRRDPPAYTGQACNDAGLSQGKFLAKTVRSRVRSCLCDVIFFLQVGFDSRRGQGDCCLLSKAAPPFFLYQQPRHALLSTAAEFHRLATRFKGRALVSNGLCLGHPKSFFESPVGQCTCATPPRCARRGGGFSRCRLRQAPVAVIIRGVA